MKDIQSLADTRNINIKKVGIKGVSYPIILSDRSKKQQHTIAEFDMYVNLPHRFKGTHMSRFLEVLEGFYNDFTLRDFPQILRQVKEKLNAEASHVELRFSYFFPKNCNRLCQQVGYSCRLYGKFEERADFLLTVDIPLEGGRRLEVSVRFHRFFWLEDVIEYAEESISSEYRKDVDHMKITEDRLCRAVSKRFEGIKELEWFSITVYNDTGFCSTFARIKGEIQ